MSDLEPTTQPETRLDEYEKEEWRLVARELRPDWTDADFDAAWNEFCEMKRRKVQS